MASLAPDAPVDVEPQVETAPAALASAPDSLSAPEAQPAVIPAPAPEAEVASVPSTPEAPQQAGPVQAPSPAAATAPEPNQTPTAVPATVSAPAVGESVVAIIGDRQIQGEVFRQRMMQELAPSPYDATPKTEAVTRDEVVRLLLGEQAIAMDARAQGLARREKITSAMREFSESQLVNMLYARVVGARVVVGEDEIARAMKVNSQLDRQQATLALQRKKARAAFEVYTNRLFETLQVKKAPEHFSQAGQIHDRLLHHPMKPRPHNASWILKDQILTELSPAEGALVLATYEGGTFTLYDLFMALHTMSPPGRPRNLGTAGGIEAFLMKSIRKPLLVTQAKLMGMDKDEAYQQKLREYEDHQMLNMVQVEKYQEIAEANEADILAYYDTVKDVVGKRDKASVKIIWCRDRAAALAAKAELVAGRPFAQVQGEFTQDDDKDMAEREVFITTEGFLWPDIWAAEPNDVVGPVLGVHTVERQYKLDWRLVQVLSKEEGTPRPLDDNLKNTLKWAIQGERTKAHFKAFSEATLAKYPYTVFEERLERFDPRNVP